MNEVRLQIELEEERRLRQELERKYVNCYTLEEVAVMLQREQEIELRIRVHPRCRLNVFEMIGFWVLDRLMPRWKRTVRLHIAAKEVHDYWLKQRQHEVS